MISNSNTIKSMTGFGRSSFAFDEQRTVDIEVKSVNHRFLEVNIRSPKILSFLEFPVRKLIADFLKRGKVDVSFNFRSTATSKAFGFDRKVFDRNVENYLLLKKELSEKKSLPLENNEILELLKISGGTSVQNSLSNEESDNGFEGKIETFQDKIVESVTAAVNQLIEHRLNEGKKTADALNELVSQLQSSLVQIGELNKTAPLALLEKTNSRICELLKNYEKNTNTSISLLEDQAKSRLIQELAGLSDKIDVNEELVRLDSHCKAFLKIVGQSTGPVGRELDFLCQEIGREINTIGSKSQSIEITTIVVDMKVTIEKIREQVQNIE